MQAEGSQVAERGQRGQILLVLVLTVRGEDVGSSLNEPVARGGSGQVTGALALTRVCPRC